MSTTLSDPSNPTLLNHPDWVSMDIEHLGKSFYNSEDVPLSDTIKSHKAKTLNEACLSKQHEILYEYLKSTDGLVNNNLRSRIWPILLGIEIKGDDHEDNDDHKSSYINSKLEINDNYMTSSDSSISSVSKKLDFKKATSFLLDTLDSNNLPPHKDEDQIKLDINRSFTILSQWQSYHQQSQLDSYTTIYSKSDVEELRKTLLSLIVKMLRKYPSLNYYQGYHDIASIILIICYDNSLQSTSTSSSSMTIDEELAFLILEKLTIFHLRDYMITDINLSINHLKLIPTLLEEIDTSFFELIKQTSNSYLAFDGLTYDYTFYQALSSILTMFSHDVNNLHQLLVIWDFILGHDSVLTSIYIYVSILLFSKDKIFEKLNLSSDYNYEEIDEYDYGHIDTDMVHSLISPSKLFEDLSDSDLIKILNKAKHLIDNNPIDEVSNRASTVDVWFDSFNKHSVLLNTSNITIDRATKNKKYNSLLINNHSQNHELSKSPTYSTELDNTVPFVLTDLIKIQDEEISKQILYEISLQNKIMEQQESLATSVNSLADDETATSYLLLSSSISSISSASSSINTKIARTSSLMFKKLFSNHVIDDHDADNESKPGNKAPSSNYNNLLFKNICKVSCTVGFIGFMIHFLLIKDSSTSNNNINVLKFFNRDMVSPLNEFNLNESVNSIGKELVVYGNEVINEAGEAISVAVSYMKDSEFVNQGFTLGQVGLGNFRDIIFGIVR